MSIKWWIRLAGCCAIKLVLAAGAADFQYKAGIASIGHARAIAFEDRRGGNAVLAQSDGALSLAVADFVAVRVMQRYEISREGLLIRGAGSGAPNPDDLFLAIGAALGAMEPAVLRFAEGQLSVAAPRGECRATITADGGLRFETCRAGEPVRSPLRVAFRVVEPEHGLQQRGEVLATHPIQAIAFGRQVVILGLGGAAAAGRFRAPGLIVMPYANDAEALPDSPRVNAAVRDLLRRVGR